MRSLAGAGPEGDLTFLPDQTRHEQAVATPNGGIEVIEAVVDRRGRRDLDARIRALAGDLP